MKIHYCIIILACLSSLYACLNPKHHYTGKDYIQDPGFELFGANLVIENHNFIIESYFRSSITGRTEYIYENFNITFPENLLLNTEYTIPDKSIIIWYARGSMAGQIETNDADGKLIIKQIKDTSIIIDLNLTFSNFRSTGSAQNIPDSIIRTGTLTAKKDYKLY